MKFSCSMCGASDEIPDKELTHPLTRTTCRDCGAILLINPETGGIEAHKTPFKDSPTYGKGSIDKSRPVVSMRPQNEQARDWTAIVVVAIILIALISVGIYFAVNLDFI